MGLELYARHLDSCNINKQAAWDEAALALAELPFESRDGSEALASEEINRKRIICSCGLDLEIERYNRRTA